jgi:lipopolysaccharide/colanic/teichoic acid biosynthesis glycosyltransferase
VSSLRSDFRFGIVKFARLVGWLDFVDPRLISDFFRASESRDALTVSNLATAGRQRIAKRAVDFFVSGIALLFFAPLFLMVFIAVKATSKGPALYRSERVGYGSRSFILYKFRTMLVGSDRVTAFLRAPGMMRPATAGGPVFKITNDPRLTPVGKLLRMTSLDELPQLYNVFCGDMSLVGPRALTLQELQYVFPDEKTREARLSVKPGITGLYLVQARRAEPLDLASYLVAHSATLDIKIFANWVQRWFRGIQAFDVEQ